MPRLVRRKPAPHKPAPRKPWQSEWPAKDVAQLTDCGFRLQALADDLFGLSYMCSILPRQRSAARVEEIRQWIDLLATRVREQSEWVLAETAGLGAVYVP